MGELGFYVLFNSISVISRRWKGEHERLCAMKRRLGSGLGAIFDRDPVIRSRGALTARPRGRFPIYVQYVPELCLLG